MRNTEWPSKATQSHAGARHRPDACEAQAWCKPGDSVLLSCVPLVLLLCSSCTSRAFPPARRPVPPTAPRQLAALLANMCSLVSQPSTCCTARIKIREPARVTWRYRFSFFSSFSFLKYRRVKWLMHSSGAGQRPIKLKLLQYDLPALHSGEALFSP